MGINGNSKNTLPYWIGEEVQTMSTGVEDTSHKMTVVKIETKPHGPKRGRFVTTIIFDVEAK